MTNSIEYRGKIYTIKDVPLSYLKKYKADPLKTWIKAKISQRKGYLKNKEARNKASKENYLMNKEHYAKVNKKRYDKKKEEILAYKKEYYQNNRDKITKWAKEYRNKPEVAKKKREYANQWRKNNPDYVPPNAKESKIKYRNSAKGKAKEKLYRESNKERAKELKDIRMSDPEYVAKSKAWYKNYNKSPETIDRRKKLHKKWSQNPQYTIKRSLRAQLKNALSLYSKDGKILSSRKYGLDYFKCIQYLEKQAEDMGYTMNKLRQMKFHIDHKIPVSAYNLNDKDDIKNCFNPINLQWLNATDNCSKGNKIIKSLIKTLPTEIYPKSWGGVIPT
tara:strand:- start:1161 stop:2159 length:999 start_codon:yes stop_codon:yes gene_type:complete